MWFLALLSVGEGLSECVCGGGDVVTLCNCPDTGMHMRLARFAPGVTRYPVSPIFGSRAVPTDLHATVEPSNPSPAHLLMQVCSVAL